MFINLIQLTPNLLTYGALDTVATNLVQGPFAFHVVSSLAVHMFLPVWLLHQIYFWQTVFSGIQKTQSQ